MTGVSEEDKAILLRFNITRTLQIQLTRLKVYLYSKKRAQPYSCHLCKYSSNNKAHLRYHLRVHTGEKPFACTLCSYKSSSKDHLNRHILAHIGEKHYNCAFCTNSFLSYSDKTRHEKICKRNPTRNVQHRVKMQKVFKCQLCHYSAARKFHLKGHMTIHTGEKPFTCIMCSHSFRLRHNLRRHIFTHTREKPHSCQFCTREFATAAHQKDHEKICNLNPKQGDAKWVEEQKKFKCRLCKYRTMRKGSLETHSRSHTGEKPYKCPLCLFKFGHNTTLHSHLRRKPTSEKGFKCSDCDFATPSTSKLLNHFKQFHIES